MGFFASPGPGPEDPGCHCRCHCHLPLPLPAAYRCAMKGLKLEIDIPCWRKQFYWSIHSLDYSADAAIWQALLQMLYSILGRPRAVYWRLRMSIQYGYETMRYLVMLDLEHRQSSSGGFGPDITDWTAHSAAREQST